MRRALLILLWLAPLAAWAHPVDQGWLELRAQDDVIQADLDLGLPLALQVSSAQNADLTPAGIAKLAPTLFAATLASGRMDVEGQPCAWGAPAAAIDAMRIRIRASARCPEPPGKLTLTLPFVEQAPPTFRVLGRATLGSAAMDLSAGPGRETIVLQGPPASGNRQLVRGLLRWLTPLGLLGLLGLLASGLGRASAPLAFAGAWILGALLAVAGFALAPVPMAIAAAVAAVAPSAEALMQTAREGRWRTSLPSGAVLGLALGPALHGALQALGAAIALAAITGVALLLGRAPRVHRVLAGALGLAAIAVALGLLA